MPLLYAADGPRTVRKVTVALPAWTGLLALFGFLIGGTAIVFLYLLFGERERATTAALCALSVALIVYLIFDRFLGLPLFEGLVVRAVF